MPHTAVQSMTVRGLPQAAQGAVGAVLSGGTFLLVVLLTVLSGHSGEALLGVLSMSSGRWSRGRSLGCALCVSCSAAAAPPAPGKRKTPAD